jgi:hypothetical protein
MSEARTASDLYGLPLDQFTPARSELAKRLRAEGDRKEAARVAKLRKPTTAAWAVNQLVRTQPKRIERLLGAGDAVARAQAGRQARKLREAVAEQRAQLAELMDRAEGLLDSDGRALSANVLGRVSETLRAGALDPDSRTQLEAGCLTRELQFTGLGGSRSSPRPGRCRGAPRGARDGTAEAVGQAEAALTEATQQLREVQRGGR